MNSSGEKVKCAACGQNAPLLERKGTPDRLGSHRSGDVLFGAQRQRCEFSGGTQEDAARDITPQDRWRGDKIRKRVELDTHAAPLGLADWTWYQEFLKRERGEI